jgi:hypothetical protein
MLHRWVLDKPGAGVKNQALNIFAAKLWGTRRALPKVAPKNFRQLWNERMQERN